MTTSQGSFKSTYGIIITTAKSIYTRYSKNVCIYIYNQQTRRRVTNTQMNSAQRPDYLKRLPTDTDSTTIEEPTSVKPRSYADILKPKYNYRTERRTESRTNYNDSRRNRATADTNTKTLPMDTRFHLQDNEQTYNYPKNAIRPRPIAMEGGMQELITNTMQAFELLQHSFARLAGIRLTRTDE